jgi:hypothetical protein
VNKEQVFEAMKQHYAQTGTVMDPVQFERQFRGLVTPQAALQGILMFDQFLDREVRKHDCIAGCR